MKQITITFDVDDTTTPEQLHELICVAVHESTIGYDVESIAKFATIQQSISDVNLG